MLQAGRSWVRVPMKSLKGFIYLIPPAAPWSWGLLSPWQKWVSEDIILEVKSDRHIRLTTYPQSKRQLYRQCGILNISNPYRPPHPVMRVASFSLHLFTRFLQVLIPLGRDTLVAVFVNHQGYWKNRPSQQLFKVWHSLTQNSTQTVITLWNVTHAFWNGLLSAVPCAWLVMLCTATQGTLNATHKLHFILNYNVLYINILGAHGSLVVKALCYKPEGRGFDTSWGDFFKCT
jgi:hypothetical protein